MLFNSYIFILLFLPITLLGFFALSRLGKYKQANVYLLGMSLWFYAYFNVKYLPIIVISLFLNYLGHIGLERIKNNQWRKAILATVILCNVGALFYFKYFDFFLQNINVIFGTDFALRHILLPLGISFFTFQQISFVVDSYRREVPHYSFVEYALFVTYFPQLIAGPIVSHDELIPQLLDKKTHVFNWDNFSKGVSLFALGLAKKVLIADIFGIAANWGFANIAGLNSTEAIVTMLSYTVQIYFDFSGYCDMAIGIGRMMNIELPVNFDSPYKSFTIVEFWSRWHKTLTRFFTKYIYIPLGGNRKGQLRTYLNTMIVFLLSGLWHGANWTFVIWGALHGAFNVISKMLKKPIEKAPKALNWLVTFVFINLTWLIFRADSMADAVELFGNILSFDFGEIDPNMINAFTLPEVSMLLTVLLGFDPLGKFAYLYLVAYYMVAFALMLFFKNAKTKTDTMKPTFVNSIFVAVVLVWSVLSLSGVSTFLYFNF